MKPTTVYPNNALVMSLRSDSVARTFEIARSMSAALHDGDAVVCIATSSQRHEIEQQLKGRGIDVVDALIKEQFVCLNALDTVMRIIVDDVPDVIRFAEVIGATVDRASTRYTRVLLFGELGLLLRSTGNASGAKTLDELWTSFVESRPAFFRSLDVAAIMRGREEQHRVSHVDGALALSD